MGLTSRATSSDLYKIRRLWSKTKKREDIIKQNITKNLKETREARPEGVPSNVFFKNESGELEEEKKFMRNFKKMILRKEKESKFQKLLIEEYHRPSPNLLSKNSYTSKMKSKIQKMKQERKKKGKPKKGKPKTVYSPPEENGLINLYRKRASENEKLIENRSRKFSLKKQMTMFSRRLKYNNSFEPKKEMIDARKAPSRNRRKGIIRENKYKKKLEKMKNHSNSEFLFKFLDNGHQLDEGEQKLRRVVLKKFLVDENAKIKELKKEFLYEKSRRHGLKEENLTSEESFHDLKWIFEKKIKKISYKNFKSLLNKSPEKVNQNVYLRAFDLLKENYEHIEQEIYNTNEEIICLDDEMKSLKDSLHNEKNQFQHMLKEGKDMDHEILQLTNELRFSEKRSDELAKVSKQSKILSKKLKKPNYAFKNNNIDNNSQLISKISKIRKAKNCKVSKAKPKKIRNKTDTVVSSNPTNSRKVNNDSLVKLKDSTFSNKPRVMLDVVDLRKNINENTLYQKKRLIDQFEGEMDIADIKLAFEDIQSLLEILGELKGIYKDDQSFLDELKIYDKLIEGYQVELKDSEHDKHMTIYTQKLEIENLKKKIEILENGLR